MIATAVQIHDVRDAAGFVAKSIQSSHILLSPDQREELMSEGLTILCELAARYEPHREGYAQPGKFSGYAAAFLPRRLEDAWHRMNPQHLSSRGEDGRREWDYGQQPMSLQHEGMPEIVGTAFLGQPSSVFSPIVDEALTRVPAEYGIAAPGVVQLLADGYTPDEIARRHPMRLNRSEVGRVQSAVGSAVWQVQQHEQEAA